MAQKNSDLQKINELIEIMKENDLVEVEIKHGDDKIFLKCRQPQQPAVTAAPTVGPNISAVPAGTNAAQSSPAEAPISNQKQEYDLVVIKSPIVGTFYATPHPLKRPFPTRSRNMIWW
jgi:acetyl-CoA carboxylase biotin carboxyl carrier protein